VEQRDALEMRLDTAGLRGRETERCDRLLPRATPYSRIALLQGRRYARTTVPSPSMLVILKCPPD